MHAPGGKQNFLLSTIFRLAMSRYINTLDIKLNMSDSGTDGNV
jgi:hypothetical protein